MLLLLLCLSFLVPRSFVLVKLVSLLVGPVLHSDEDVLPFNDYFLTLLVVAAGLRDATGVLVVSVLVDNGLPAAAIDLRGAGL